LAIVFSPRPLSLFLLSSFVPGAHTAKAIGIELLKQKERVAVLAVDPTSRFSGGSILGDKVCGTFASRVYFFFFSGEEGLTLLVEGKESKGKLGATE
jgi:hypothetical protein